MSSAKKNEFAKIQSLFMEFGVQKEDTARYLTHQLQNVRIGYDLINVEANIQGLSMEKKNIPDALAVPAKCEEGKKC